MDSAEIEHLHRRATQLFVYGAILVFFLGANLETSWLNLLGLVLLGLGLISAGLYGLRNGNLDLFRRRKKDNSAPGVIPDSTWSIVLLCAGASVLILFLFLLFGLDQRILSAGQRFLATETGSALFWLLFGIGFVLFGISDLRGNSSENDSLSGIVRSIPARLFGLGVVLIGLGIVLVNLLRLLAPDRLTALTSLFLQWLGLR